MLDNASLVLVGFDISNVARLKGIVQSGLEVIFWHLLC